MASVSSCSFVRICFFTSSHPKDLLPETIDAMAETPAVMPQLHLAVQSGSTRILKEMNRRYTREDYLGLVDRIRNRMPDIALSTDIIVPRLGDININIDDFADELIDAIASRNRRMHRLVLLPVFCGGTGLYLKAALDEMDFPSGDLEDERRAGYQELAERIGEEALHGAWHSDVSAS